MNFSGVNNVLFVPQVLQAQYLFDNIVVNSTGVYHVSGIHYAGEYISGSGIRSRFFSLSGNKILNPSGKFFSTYNTGEPFSISGWYDYSQGSRYIVMGEMLDVANETQSRGYLGNVIIGCPANGTLSCDILLKSYETSASATFRHYQIGNPVTGVVTASTAMFLVNDSMRFYHSYEQLLSGGTIPAVICIDSGIPAFLRFSDTDTSYTNNSQVDFDYHLNASYGDNIVPISISRTGLYSSYVMSATDVSVSSGFSGLFDGYWSGSGFYFEDTWNYAEYNYQLTFNDMLGTPYPKTGRVIVSIYKTGVSMPADYITGFRLISGGEYIYPPIIEVTGYFSVTGLTQGLNTMLFSSGCSGNLPVTFTGANNLGTGASGLLILATVAFPNVYKPETTIFRIPIAYSGIMGTGYSLSPKAYVGTGIFGSSCFDVPRVSGNYGWFKSFNASGTMDVEANWFSGEALCQTGLLSDGVTTGYKVTGIDVHNLGSGYVSGRRPPTMSFRRTGVGAASLGNYDASGALLMKTGAINQFSAWQAYAGIAGRTLSRISFNTPTGIPMEIEDSMLSVQIACSGLDVTSPITGRIQVGFQNTTVSGVTNFVFRKFYDTDPNALKKKTTPMMLYSSSDPLDFMLSESDLDSFYSSPEFTDNNWGFDEGDFDF